MSADIIPTVRVRAQFQRSVRLDADFDRPDALAGYILQPSPRNAMETVARHIDDTQQRAFTWTGPYGGGKSSLALALASLSGGSKEARRAARAALELKQDDVVNQVFGSRKPWLVLPVVGRREAVETAIGAAIDQLAPLPGRKPARNGRRDVIAELVRRAESSEHGGVLLLLDELGKFLEAAAATGDDIFFYQELAEAASRCDGRLVVVGVLHQAFEQYGARLGREVREEWAKVQGRYVDIPVVAGSDEVLDLIGRAIESNADHSKTLTVAKRIAASIHRRRPASPPNLAQSLDRCWPLHPVTAALLGPSSRRKFGQNERSVFGFLTSAEPRGFRDFLANRTADAPAPYYTPADYWDFLRANLENAILVSPDGHRWAIAAEAVERVESRFSEPHVSLVKSVGLIELFRNGSGVTSETDVLVECVQSWSRAKIESALEELARASILIYRKHQKAWGVFAGSDFDIEAAVSAAITSIGQLDIAHLKNIASLPPVSARRHYVETGTLRWFDCEVVPAADASRLSKDHGATARTGRFVLMLPSTECNEQKAMRIAGELSRHQGNGDLVLYGVPHGYPGILEQAAELAALEHVSRNKPELEGDSVARREIEGRLRQLRSDLAGVLSDAFASARWYFEGQRYGADTSHGLSRLASTICDLEFPHSPVIHSELVNRDALSSSAAKAQRMLLHRMLAFGNRPHLDYDGYPADAGLYYTAVAELGVHRKQGGEWAFVAPDRVRTEGAVSLVPLWRATTAFLEEADGPVTLESLYALWRAAPYGVKKGVLPVLALAYLLANRSRIAIYVEGMFVPDLTDANIDEWLQDPSRITWKQIRIDADAKRLLGELAERLEQVTSRPVAADPLDSARALVSLTLAMPAWVQRTARLSDPTRAVRTVLLRASDPVKVIFSDLPEILHTRGVTELVDSIGEVITEMQAAYPSALRTIEERLLKTIDHRGNWEDLRERAQVVQGISGDFKVDAFASRLRSYAGELSDIEGMISLAVSKPPQAFTDHDLDNAALQLAKWAFEFRQVEALASIQGRVSTRQALAVVFGGGRTISGSFDVSEQDGREARALADHLIQRVVSGQVRPDIFLAAVIDAGSRVLEEQQEKEHG